MMILAEELLLLALDDERGSILPSAAEALPVGIASALLMDLGIRGRLRTAQDGSVLVEGSPVGDDILDQTADRITRESRPRTFDDWIRRLASSESELRQRLFERLAAAGTLRHEEHRTLLIFKSTRYVLTDSSVERAIRDRIRTVVLDGATPDERTAALIGLVRSCNLVDYLFAPAERAEAGRRIEELTGDTPMMQQVYGGGMQGALMTALMASMLMSSVGPGFESGMWDESGDSGDGGDWGGGDSGGGFE